MKLRFSGLALTLGLFLTGAGPSFADEKNVPPVWLIENFLTYQIPLKIEMQDMETCFYFLLRNSAEQGFALYANVGSIKEQQLKVKDIDTLDIKMFLRDKAYISTGMNYCIRTSAR
jgi:hypothetical protein